MATKLQKLLLMFIPLTLGFSGLTLAIHDLKHPEVVTEECSVIGRGLAVQKYKSRSRTLYRRSNNEQDDLAFRCQRTGNVIINDEVPLPVRTGESVKLTTKSFRYLPQRYYVELPVESLQVIEKFRPSQEKSSAH
jgi:hypothetical protein